MVNVILHVFSCSTLPIQLCMMQLNRLGESEYSFLASSLITLLPPHTGPSLLFKHIKLAPCLESLYVLFPLPGTHFSPVITWLSLLSPSSLCSNVSLLVRPFLDHPPEKSCCSGSVLFLRSVLFNNT